MSNVTHLLATVMKQALLVWARMNVNQWHLTSLKLWKLQCCGLRSKTLTLSNQCNSETLSFAEGAKNDGCKNKAN